MFSAAWRDATRRSVRLSDQLTGQRTDRSLSVCVPHATSHMSVIRNVRNSWRATMQSLLLVTTFHTDISRPSPMVKFSRNWPERRSVTPIVGVLPPQIGVPVPPKSVPVPWQELESLYIAQCSFTDYSRLSLIKTPCPVF